MSIFDRLLDNYGLFNNWFLNSGKATVTPWLFYEDLKFLFCIIWLLWTKWFARMQKYFMQSSIYKFHGVWRRTCRKLLFQQNHIMSVQKHCICGHDILNTIHLPFFLSVLEKSQFPMPIAILQELPTKLVEHNYSV